MQGREGKLDAEGIEKVGGFGRRRSVSVAEFLVNEINLIQLARRRQLPVKADPLRLDRDVALGQPLIDGPLHFGRPKRLGRGLSSDLDDGFLQQLAIEVEPNVVDRSALLGAQNVARPPNFHVAHGDRKPHAELGELFQRRQALHRRVGDRLSPGQDQVSIGLAHVASHASAQLIKLSQPHRVGPVDDDRVDVGDVDSVLDDRGRDQDIEFAGDEIQHDPFEFGFVHPAVSDGEARLRHHLAHRFRDVLDRCDPIVNEEDLPAPVQLAQDRLLQIVFLEINRARLDGMAVRRRRLDDAEIAHLGERHVKRARDRRRRQREDVDLGPHRFDPFLLLHAETLLLVDDQQPQVAELHVLGNEPVRADDEMNLSAEKIAQRLLLPRRAPEPAEHVHAEWIIRQPLLEGLIVLLGEDRRGAQKRDLAVFHEHFERRADRHFGLAIADVAADEPIRRPRLHEVGLDLPDRFELVRRLLINKGRFELLLPNRIGTERGFVSRLTLGIELKQFTGKLADRLLGFLSPSLPFLAAHPVQRRDLPVRRSVFLNEVKLLDRHEQAISIQIKYLKKLAHPAIDTLTPDHFELADPVIGVNNVIAALNLRRARKKFSMMSLAINPAPLVAAEDLAVGQHEQLGGGQNESLVQLTDQKHDGNR